jgi:hypothetical protein
VLAEQVFSGIPELLTLARTISRWEDKITAAVTAGITNATSESLNRLAKLEPRQAYGFRNPLNQRRRVRIACTRGYRRHSRTATLRRAHPVAGRNPIPANFEGPEMVIDTGNDISIVIGDQLCPK